MVGSTDQDQVASGLVVRPAQDPNLRFWVGLEPQCPQVGAVEAVEHLGQRHAQSEGQVR